MVLANELRRHRHEPDRLDYVSECGIGFLVNIFIASLVSHAIIFRPIDSFWGIVFPLFKIG